MNNKGYAITSVIYGILLIFLLVVFSTLSILITRGNTLNKIKKNALNTVAGNVDTTSIPYYVADFDNINVVDGASNYGTIDYNSFVISPYGYDITNTLSGDTINYRITNRGSLVTDFTKTLVTGANALVTNYDYTSKVEKVMLEPGIYKLETWGGETVGASGVYASGYITLSERTILYINVGGSKVGMRDGYNSGNTIVASDSDMNNILISSSNTYSFGSDVSNTSYYDSTCTNDTATINCRKNGNGYIRISSLVYTTK